jgi:hypothetical protein
MLKDGWETRRESLISHYFNDFEKSIVALKADFVSQILVLTLSKIRHLLFYILNISLAGVMQITIVELKRKSCHDSLAFLNGSVSGCGDWF